MEPYPHNSKSTPSLIAENVGRTSRIITSLTTIDDLIIDALDAINERVSLRKPKTTFRNIVHSVQAIVSHYWPGIQDDIVNLLYLLRILLGAKDLPIGTREMLIDADRILQSVYEKQLHNSHSGRLVWPLLEHRKRFQMRYSMMKLRASLEDMLWTEQIRQTQ